MMLKRLFLITLLILCPVIAEAQDAAESAPVDEFVSVGSNVSDYELRKGQNEFGIWGGGAFNATTIFGGLRKEEAADRKYLIVGLRYGRVLAAAPGGPRLHARCHPDGDCIQHYYCGSANRFCA